MEDSVNNLEALIQKADSDLNYLSRKLDIEFGKTGGDDGQPQVNPQQLVQKVTQVKKDFADIKKDVQGIQQAQQEMMEYFRTELTTACDMINKLPTQTGTQESVELPDLSAFENILGLKLPTSGGGNCAAGGTTEGHQAAQSVSPPTEALQPGTTKEKSLATGGGFELSPAARQKQSAECIELTQGEFESVSEFIRGRVKLPDVNRTYQRLWQYFVEEGNREELSTQDMFKMGLKVSGATGEAKLKVLKALKLISINKKGSVKLMKD